MNRPHVLRRFAPFPPAGQVSSRREAKCIADPTLVADSFKRARPLADQQCTLHPSYRPQNAILPGHFLLQTLTKRPHYVFHSSRSTTTLSLCMHAHTFRRPQTLWLDLDTIRSCMTPQKAILRFVLNSAQFPNNQNHARSTSDAKAHHFHSASPAKSKT